MIEATSGDEDALVVLSIELSQREGGVAIVSRSGRHASVDVAGGRRDTDDLAPAVESAFERASIDPSEVGRLAVDVGPGGFTGLRISVAFAQMFAEVRRIPVFAAPSSLVAIASTPDLTTRTGLVDVCVAAKRESVWRTRFMRTDANAPWRVVEAGGLVETAGGLDDVDLVLADDHLGDGLRDAYRAAGVSRIDPTYSAETLGELVLADHPDVRRLEDPAQLLPIYPRIPEAVRVWREKIPR